MNKRKVRVEMKIKKTYSVSFTFILLLIWKGYYQKNINEKLTYIGKAKRYPPPINNYPLY